MKKIFCALIALLGAAVFCGAEGIAEEAGKGNERADVSYAFGIVVASDLAGTGLEFNYDAFTRGFRQVMENEKTLYSMDEALEKIQAAFQAAQVKLGEKNRAEGEAYLAENGKRPGVVTTPSGLQYETLAEGTGETPNAADIVRVHYHGTLIDGTVFDTTREDGESAEIAAEIPLDRVIPGWSEGIRLMKTGGKIKLFIPPNLAYGERGAGNPIGPNTTLVFEVELLGIVEPEQEETVTEEPRLPEETPDAEKTGE